MVAVIAPARRGARQRNHSSRTIYVSNRMTPSMTSPNNMRGTKYSLACVYPGYIQAHCVHSQTGAKPWVGDGSTITHLLPKILLSLAA
jgi:hypothetical protein